MDKIYTNARWKHLSVEQQREFGNGCGAAWMDESAAGRWLKHHLFNWFFEACCAHHDFGYIKGGNLRDKLDCDWKFMRAMWRDVDRLRRRGRIGKMLVASVLVPLFYAAVSVGGFPSFHFGKQRSLCEILEFDAKGKR